MSIELETLNRINTLKTNIEAVTGGSYDNLTSAVQALKDGYSSSTEEQYSVYEVKFDFVTGYIGLANLGNNIFGVEVAPEVEREDGTIDVLPENAVIKRVEFYFNGNVHKLEDAQELDGRDAWVGYPANNTMLSSEMIGGRVVASLYYYNTYSPDAESLLYCMFNSAFEYDSPIRVYYTV